MLKRLPAFFVSDVWVLLNEPLTTHRTTPSMKSVGANRTRGIGCQWCNLFGSVHLRVAYKFAIKLISTYIQRTYTPVSQLALKGCVTNNSLVTLSHSKSVLLLVVGNFICCGLESLYLRRPSAATSLHASLAWSALIQLLWLIEKLLTRLLCTLVLRHSFRYMSEYQFNSSQSSAENLLNFFIK